MAAPLRIRRIVLGGTKPDHLPRRPSLKNDKLRQCRQRHHSRNRKEEKIVHWLGVV